MVTDGLCPLARFVLLIMRSRGEDGGIPGARRTQASLGPRQSPFQHFVPIGTVWPPLATAPMEGRAARLAKQTLGRARISWTGWRPGGRGAGRAQDTRRACASRDPPALGPWRSCSGSATSSGARKRQEFPLPGPASPSGPGYGAESPTCHPRRPTWVGLGAGVEGWEKRRRRRGRWE